MRLSCLVAVLVTALLWNHVAQAVDFPEDLEISHLLHAETFEKDLSDWVVEQQPGGTTGIRDGQLEISDSRGCTIWFRHELEAPVLIQYEPTILSGTGPNDDVRDLNCFWMARDPESPGDLFAGSAERGGDFNKYNPLRLYYVGYGGNHNKTTRFRRYTGTGEKPLLPEHDLRDPEYMITPDRTMQIQIIVYGNRTLYLRNGEVVFDFTDEDPYTDGWFGFRTVSNHMTLDNFRVYRLRERQQGLPAFPGAEGFGSTTPGGRGGRVLTVNNLSDYGPGEDPVPGSLRQALESPGPRTVVFTVNGIIRLKAPLVIGSLEDPMLGESRSFLTVAGQSAPGGGITLADQPLIVTNVHDVVLRHLRVRESPNDGISFMHHSRRVVVDHCSVSWSRDENIGMNGDHQDVTLSYGTIAECLHGHSMGCVVTKGAHRVSVHHNYFTGNGHRNAQFVGSNGYWAREKKERFGIPKPHFDFRNNLLFNCYNWTSVKDGAQVNVADNLYVRGAGADASSAGVSFFNDQRGSAAWLSGNAWSWQETGEDQRALASAGKMYLTEKELEQNTQDVTRCLRDEPLPAPPVTTVPAGALPRVLLPVVGALPHDAVDARLVREFAAGKGHRGAEGLPGPREVPEPVIGSAPNDIDFDGMPDRWEEEHGLDRKDPDDAVADPDGNGYSNLEEYLNEVHSLLQEPAPANPQVIEAMKKADAAFRQNVMPKGGYLRKFTAPSETPESATDRIRLERLPAIGLAWTRAYEATGDETYLDVARDVAHTLAWTQLASGGWNHRMRSDAERAAEFYYRRDSGEMDKGDRINVTVFDDDVSQSAARMLMLYDHATDFQDETAHDASRYALTRFTEMQYTNGGWPMWVEQIREVGERQARYPESWPRTYKREFYPTYFTINDGAVPRVIDALLMASAIYGDDTFLESARRGGDFLLAAQMPQPQPAWAQQYTLLMVPTWARKFEPPSIVSAESVEVIESLMNLYVATGDARYREAVEPALNWLERSRLPDGRHARFYELETNRPLYFNMDYELVYTDTDLPTHYRFQVNLDLENLRGRFANLDAARAEYVRAGSRRDERLGALLGTPGRQVTPQVVRSVMDDLEGVTGDLPYPGRDLGRHLAVLSAYVSNQK